MKLHIGTNAPLPFFTGYGDLSPTNLASKIFTCIFGLTGVACLGVAIATIGSSLVEAELEAARKLRTAHFIKVFDNMPMVIKQCDHLHSDEEEQHQDSLTPTKDKLKQDSKSYWSKSLWKALPALFPSVSLLFIGGSIMGQLEGWSWWDSIYYSVITAGTLGYGDFSPKTQFGRILAIAFLPIAVAAAGELLGTFSKLLIARRQHLRNEHLLSRELDMAYLTEMDADGNGTVSRLEYITFMLQSMGVVDTELLTELNEQFDALDVNKDGSLGVEDLKLMAKVSGLKVKS
jgi:hypothetical protein